jgi:hypothetical protein
MIDYNLFEYFFLGLWFVGADDDVEASKEFIKNKYLRLVPPRGGYAEKNIYPHFTCSVGKYFFFVFDLIHLLSSNLDSKNIQIVFESVKDTVLAHNLYYWTPY